MQRSVLMISAAESDLKNLPFDAVQSAHVLELAKRLAAFGDPEETADLEITALEHFYEVRQLLDFGGPLRSAVVQLRFGVLERDHGEIVVLQVLDHHDQPDAIEMLVLEDRYSDFLCLPVSATTLL